MLNTHHVDSVVEVVDGIEDAGLPLLAQEAIVECHLCHTAFLCQSAHLFVGEVARVVAQRTSRGMGTDDG